jgi:hypothetical protein
VTARGSGVPIAERLAAGFAGDALRLKLLMRFLPVRIVVVRDAGLFTRRTW